MSEPLFSVGEVVYVIGQYTGIHYGVRVISGRAEVKNLITTSGGLYSGWAYVLDKPVNHYPVHFPIPEVSLRKKPPLGDSFDQIIAELKNPSHISEPL